MKRKLIVLALTVFALAVLTPAAFAAVESGGVEYVWYVEGYGTLKISADGGRSYAELPEMAQAQALTGQDYSVATAVSALPDGGLRVEARDRWGTEAAFWRDYSAAELKKAMETAEETPVYVLCTNGAGMTLGVWESWETESAPNTGDIMADWRYPQSAYQLVYTTDGVTWQEQPWPEGMNSAEDAWWDGSSFYIYDNSDSVQSGIGTRVTYVQAYASSPDGLHWTVGQREYEEDMPRSRWSRGAELGPYYFDVYDGEIYLLRRDNWDTGVLLPHMGQAIREKGIAPGRIVAWYGPGDTVLLSVYDSYQYNKSAVTISYPVSSLDWCLNNLSKPFRGPEESVSNGGVSLAVAEGYSVWADAKYKELLRNDGTGWKRVEGVPFGPRFELASSSGETFFVVDQTSGLLYASRDGQTWTSTDAVRPADWNGGGVHDSISCSVAQTDTGYVLCRKAWEFRHGMMGMGGGKWYEGNTKLYFLDGDLRLTGTYDFGRLVEKVGYANGTCYAQVANSTGTHQIGWSEDDKERFNGDLGSTLYRSADGKNWTALGREYLDMADILVPLKGGSLSGNLPTNDPNKPLRTVAQVGKYRFILAQGYEDRWEVDLLAGNAADEYCLGEFTTAIPENWISPGEVTAEEMGDGRIKVTVTDLSTPSMKCSFTYTTQELDQGIAAPSTMGYRGGVGAEACKPGVADVAAIEMPLGEVEIVYRDATTNGKYMWYDSVPWSNSVVLLPYSGKDFFVLDKVDGKLYRSADGRTWQEAAGDLFPQLRERALRWSYGGSLAYSIVWTGSQYLVSTQYYAGMGSGSHVGGYTDPGSGKVFFLDEDLNVASSHDFGCLVERVGYADGVYYAEAGSFAWDGARYSRLTGTACYRSTDGANWEETDILQVREALDLPMWAE